ncbi:Fc receptor-like protein 5 isoform X2 [Hyperolius riggenbachi]|uniref:Fc receptor-like protein 5 isoform X2 n=1 Tax=Hyperolius riggenbachi TaxID=752182 RepID=UPI0035A3828E
METRHRGIEGYFHCCFRGWSEMGVLSELVFLIIASMGPSELISLRPVVVFTPPWRHIVSGDDVNMTCDLGSAPLENETYYWYRNEKLLNIHQQNLTIKLAFSDYDYGDYQCRTITSDFSDPVPLYIEYSSIILQKPSEVYEGGPLTLRCYSPPAFSVKNTTFYKDGKLIHFSVNDTELHMDKVDRSAIRMYSCNQILTLQHTYSDWFAKTYVYVRGNTVRSVVTFTPDWRNIMDGDHVIITCNVAAPSQEKETFYWYHHDQLMDNNQQNFTVSLASWAMDHGYYQCRTNTSDISEPAKLDVGYDLTDYTILQKPTSIHSGDPLTLRCRNRYPDDVVVSTTFYKDDRVVKHSPTDSELHIDKVDASVSGIYRCAQRRQIKYSAHEEKGPKERFLTDSAVTFITVKASVRPVVTFTPHWRNILSGESVTITCDSALQDDQPYYWYRDERVLDHHQQNFTIPSASWRDSGEYKCRTRTSVMSYPVLLEVSDADIILQRSSTSVYEGQSITLRCHSRSGYNGMNTTFYKNDDEIHVSTDDPQLVIGRLDGNSSGVYRCTQLLQTYNSTLFSGSSEIQIYVKALEL